jgi:hypothetical protein
MNLITKVKDWPAGQTLCTTNPTVLERHMEEAMSYDANEMLLKFISESNPNVVCAEITITVNIRLSSPPAVSHPDAAQGDAT